MWAMIYIGYLLNLRINEQWCLKISIIHRILKDLVIHLEKLPFLRKFFPFYGRLKLFNFPYQNM